MKAKTGKKTSLCAFAAALCCALAANADTVRVDAARKVRDLSPRLWGIFFEDIGMAVDGTLHSEMVRNGSFDPGLGTQYWKAFGLQANVSVDDSKPISEKNRWCMLATTRYGGGIRNEGYFGIHAARANDYELSLMLRGDVDGAITVSLEGADEYCIASAKIENVTKEWKQYKLAFRPMRDVPSASLVMRAPAGSYFYIDNVSLMPKHTFKGHGCRKDVAGMLADLKPKFFRFPGGCWVEGYPSLDRAYRWKDTIGDRWERRPQWNLEWSYHSTHVMGYHEYLQFAEDLGAIPVFCINAGMTCQLRKKYETVPMDKMGEWVQDALDAIEYATGPVTSKWGALRAAAGHPEPFEMPYFEVGNENYGPDYDERYALFYDAIKKAYPGITIIANENEAANVRPLNRPLEMVDEHYYKAHHWFNSNSTRYDSYPRDGYRVFVGEFAVKRRKGNILNAISEAAFMIGLERNADIVEMAAYAPLLSNANMPSSHPIGIYADASRCYGTPSYYVQKMFGENYATELLDCKVDAPDCITDYDNRPVKQKAIFANALRDGNEIVVKIVNYANEERIIDLEVANGSFRPYAKRTMLTSPHPYAENSLENPCAVAPREDVVPLGFPVPAPAHSLQVLRLSPVSK